jgi:tetratricopeptide (TPR) repeat protein
MRARGALGRSKRPAAWLACALLLVAPAARAQDAAGGPETGEVNVAGLVERLAGDDEADRQDARERLSRLGAGGQEALRKLLAHADPDVRFQLLELLGERDARVELLLREIIEKRASSSGTFASALAARAELLKEAGQIETRLALARLARTKAGRSQLSARWVTTSLDLLAELLRLAPATPPDVASLAALLEVDLGIGISELASCFAAVPRDQAIAVLRAACGQGAAIVRTRAAWILAEVAGPQEGQAAARALVPLLTHPHAGVRRAGLRALSNLSVPDDADPLVLAGRLATDQDPLVAEEALRLAGERRLTFAREAAEKLAADPATTPPLRRQAVRTLGLLEQPGAAVLLRKLAMDGSDSELQVLAGWALGAVHAPDAPGLVRALTAQPELAGDERLYTGLARSGGEGALDVLLALMQAPPPGGDPNDIHLVRRARAIEALGLLKDPPPRLFETLAELVQRAAAKNPRQRFNEELDDIDGEALRAVQGLVRLADAGAEAARDTLARLVIKTSRDTPLLALLEGVSTAGPPKDPILVAQLTQSLVANLGRDRAAGAAARALARVDSARARVELSRLIGRFRGGIGLQGGDGLELVRVLARCGDPGPLRPAIQEARNKLKDEQRPGMDRLDRQNGLGIELLYGGQFDEAIVEFRRMLWCEPANSVAAYNVACGHALSGRTEEALRALRRSLRCGYGDPTHMMADSDLDSLRADPRFARIMSRLRADEETDVVATGDDWPPDAEPGEPGTRGERPENPDVPADARQPR